MLTENLCPAEITKTGNVRTIVTLRRSLVTIVAVEKRQVLRILSVCLKPRLFSMHSICAIIYCHLWPFRLCNIFPHYLIKGTTYYKSNLTFRNLASYIQDGRKITLYMPHFIFIQQISVLNILNMLHNLHFFSSKCRLFHNVTLFGFCITHILNTGCAKI